MMKKTIVSGAMIFSILACLLFYHPLRGYADEASTPPGYSGSDIAIRDIFTSAKKGDIKAQFKLGQMYLKGRGVPRDYVLSYMWFNLSGAGGYKAAREELNTLEAKMPAEQVREAQKMSLEFK